MSTDSRTFRVEQTPGFLVFKDSPGGVSRILQDTPLADAFFVQEHYVQDGKVLHTYMYRLTGEAYTEFMKALNQDFTVKNDIK